MSAMTCAFQLALMEHLDESLLSFWPCTLFMDLTDKCKEFSGVSTYFRGRYAANHKMTKKPVRPPRLSPFCPPFFAYL